MGDFVLPLFPQGVLSQSVITTVWIGVMVTCFFNLRLGWVLSGLVVPGYMVPLLIIKPWAAGIVLFEGCLTYFIFWVANEKIGPRLGITNCFGRDRFFGILLLSVVIRLVFDTWILPFLGAYLVNTFGLVLDYRANLHSFGLIIVALIANQLWKPGMRSGLLALLIETTITYLIVRYFLVPWTNFNLSNFNYMYEDLAVSLLASPKAYIIILTAAFIASRMNLYYGWEFNGILVPSLLALQWYQPGKILFSFIEAFFILLLAVSILRLPIFKKISVEGARKIVLFFNISFFYKVVIGFVVSYYFPYHKITDYYGFGYLLPSLLAIKMYDKEKVLLITRATVQTSLVSVFIASIVGFLITLAPRIAVPVEEPVSEETVLLESKTDNYLKALENHKIRLYKSKVRNSYLVPLPKDIEMFREALVEIYKYKVNRDTFFLQKAERYLNLLNYDVSLFEDRYLVLEEREPSNGWGLYIFDLNTESNLQLQVPYPLEEWGIVEVSGELFDYLGAGSLAIAGASRDANFDGSSDVLKARPSFMEIFQNTFKRNDILQVRGYTARHTNLLRQSGLLERAGGLGSLKTGMYIKRELPPDLHVASLEELLGDYNLIWRAFPDRNVLRESSKYAYAQLMLSRKDRRKLFFKPDFAELTIEEEVRNQNIQGYLQDWILSEKSSIARKGTNLYTKPTLEELLFFDFEIFTPLLDIMDRYYRNDAWTDEGLEEIASISRVAKSLDYQIILYRDQISRYDYLILADAEESGSKYWGTYVFKLGECEQYIVEIPRPLYEVNVFEFGVSLFSSINAKALFISGTHPDANDDGSADLIKKENRQNIFTLANQVLLRENAKEPWTVLFCRSFAYRDFLPNTDKDLILAPYIGKPLTDLLKERRNLLLRYLDRVGFSYTFADGNSSVVGYELGSFPQSRYINETRGNDFFLLWLSENARVGYRQQTENISEEVLFNTIGIKTKELDIYSLIQSLPSLDSLPIIDPSLESSVIGYIKNRDIVLLQSILANWAEYKYTRLVDVNNKQAFLFLQTRSGAPVALINLLPRNLDAKLWFIQGVSNRTLFKNYMDSRDSWMLFKRNEQ